MGPVGQSGGLALFYMNDPSVSILYADKHMIDIETRFEGHDIFMTLFLWRPCCSTSGLSLGTIVTHEYKPE